LIIEEDEDEEEEEEERKKERKKEVLRCVGSHFLCGVLSQRRIKRATERWPNGRLSKQSAPLTD